MAFVATNFDMVRHVGANKIWWYKSTTDTVATITASGYFNDYIIDVNDGDQIAVGDVIFVYASNGLIILRIDTISAAGVITTERGFGESIWLQVRVPTLATAASFWTVAPIDGNIGRVKVVAEGAISDDTTLGLELANVDVTGAQLTLVASGSAAGDVTEGVATAANAVTEGGAIEVTVGGEGSTASAANVLIEILPA